MPVSTRTACLAASGYFLPLGATLGNPQEFEVDRLTSATQEQSVLSTIAPSRRSTDIPRLTTSSLRKMLCDRYQHQSCGRRQSLRLRKCTVLQRLSLEPRTGHRRNSPSQAQYMLLISEQKSAMRKGSALPVTFVPPSQLTYFSIQNHSGKTFLVCALSSVSTGLSFSF